MSVLRADAFDKMVEDVQALGYSVDQDDQLGREVVSRVMEATSTLVVLNAMPAIGAAIEGGTGPDVALRKFSQQFANEVSLKQAAWLNSYVSSRLGRG